jgi:transposase
MGGRGELTDAAWMRIARLLPENGGRGGQWRDHRTVVNGILWKLRTGAPWRDLPERYGPWQTCADRLYRWRRDGTWDRLLAHVQTKAEAMGAVDWEVSVDGTIARAHQHASGARRHPSAADVKRGYTTRRTRRWGAAAAG